MIGFVTYAQNFEDLMLWRALKDVKDGFYIDVGAADPEEDSVTRAFYDRGWRGVNIEPGPDHFAALAAARPRDINLSCLAGDSPGEQTLYHIPDTGLSTVAKELARRHATDGRPADPVRVQVRTLADICGEFAPPDIHFLKIDVEGAEADVLRGSDFSTYRPWIVLVEATVPMSQTENWQIWDPLLIQADYSFVWFDGLNRFYLAMERVDDLRHAFVTPPNFFDDWMRPRGPEQMALLRRAYALQEALEQLRAHTANDRANLDAELVAARAELQASRTEASAHRAEASAYRGETSAYRAETSAVRVAELAARQEAAAAQADAGALRAALAAAQQDGATARSESVTLKSALVAAEQNLETARAAIHDATVVAFRTSTCWRLTAPLRALSRGPLYFFRNPSRRQRLRLVAGVEQGPAGAKGLARIGVYALARSMARMPAGRTAARLVRAGLPGPYRWLHTRYLVYRGAADHSTDLPIEPIQQPICQSAEEQIMLLRLRARGEA